MYTGRANRNPWGKERSVWAKEGVIGFNRGLASPPVKPNREFDREFIVGCSSGARKLRAQCRGRLGDDGAAGTELL